MLISYSTLKQSSNKFINNTMSKLSKKLLKSNFQQLPKLSLPFKLMSKKYMKSQKYQQVGHRKEEADQETF